jgi:hypothetical protein
MWRGKSNLQDFRDIHKGKMAFLIGGGVSIDAIEEETLKPYITTVVNDVIIKITKPDYFFSCDGGVYQYDLLDYIPKESSTKVFLTGELIDDNFEGTNIRGKSIDHFYSLNRKDNYPEPESTTMRLTDEITIKGLTSLHPAAHLLWVMGCDPIVLLGCECKFTDGVFSFYMLPKYKHLLNKHYINDEGNADLPLPGKHKEILRKDLPGHLSAFRQYWDKMKKLAPDIPIIDACNSAMVAYPKMTLEEVLQKYGDRTKE